jgi:dipeptidyl aminopeptidase/acylaminoacyl peptidase
MHSSHNSRISFTAFLCALLIMPISGNILSTAMRLVSSCPEPRGELNLPDDAQLWSVSPDGCWAVYSERLGVPEQDWVRRYWLTDLVAGKPVNSLHLFDGAATVDYVIGFASDSSALFYRVLATTADYEQGIWLVPLPGVQNRRAVYTDMIQYWEWAPDGRHVLVIPYDQGGDLIAVDGTVDRVIPSGSFIRRGGGSVSWSPQGDEIAYVEEGDWWGKSEPSRLWVVDVQSRQRRQLYLTEGPVSLNPDWSPDGQTIAVYDPGTSPQPLALVSASGGLLAAIPLPGDILSEKWSPDGKQLAVTYIDSSNGHTKQMLAIVSASSGRLSEMPLEGLGGFEEWMTPMIDQWTSDSHSVIVEAPTGRGNVSVQLQVR